MKELWRSRSFFSLVAFLILSLYLLNLDFCLCLNDEGVALLKFKERVVYDPYGALLNWRDEAGLEGPCSWSGVGCTEGCVVALNLKNLCLKGTLAPEIGNLVHLKSIILRNNSFSGDIPEEIANLKELEELDLGSNNFSGNIPCQLGNNFSKATLLLDNNALLHSTNLEINHLPRLSEVQGDEHVLSSAARASTYKELVDSWKSEEIRKLPQRKLLQDPNRRPFWRFLSTQPVVRQSPSPVSFPSPNSPSPSPAPAAAQEPSQSPVPAPEPLAPSPSPFVTHISPPLPSTPVARRNGPSENSRRVRHRHQRSLLLSAAIGGPMLLLFVIAGLLFCKSGKVATVRPWATGLSGQLQRAFVTGVPKLKRAELEAACEDFSNVIGSLSVGTLYKGTLSNGVEIAVASINMASTKEWSKSLESQFRKKIDTLSKVNHKNFVNLLGFCEEEKPFTRMMVFEYAPNGTLFEHLHIQEAEHLDWEMRLRIAMGMAYSLDHMHQLTPPLLHRNLTSSSVYLTEDYAAKISDFIFSDKGTPSLQEQNVQSNVYSFGVVLFEMITGKLPYSSGSDSLEDWASDYLIGQRSLREMADPTLSTYSEDQLQEIGGVIRLCVNPNPGNRPSMKEVCGKLREITGIGAEAAIPKLSPLWWAELEILSTEAS